jgi:hypothetical protein
MPRPTAAGSITARKPVITPACSSLRTRSPMAGAESPMALAIAACVARPSSRRISRMRLSMASKSMHQATTGYHRRCRPTAPTRRAEADAQVRYRAACGCSSSATSTAPRHRRGQAYLRGSATLRLRGRQRRELRRRVRHHPLHFRSLRDAGVDVVTLGNHTFDQAEAAELLEETPRLVRPLTYPRGTPGVGFVTLPGPRRHARHRRPGDGAHLHGPDGRPVRRRRRHRRGRRPNDPVIVEVHAEATSEKRSSRTTSRAAPARSSAPTRTSRPPTRRSTTGTASSITDVGMTGVGALVDRDALRGGPPPHAHQAAAALQARHRHRDAVRAWR